MRNKEELFSMPGLCTFAVSFGSCDGAGSCAGSPRCIGEGQLRPGEGLPEATATSGLRASVETQVCL